MLLYEIVDCCTAIYASCYSGNYDADELVGLYYADGTTACSAEAASCMSVKSEVGQSTEFFAGSLTISACDYARLMTLLALASYNPETASGVVVITTGAPVERDAQGIYLMCAKITEFIYQAKRCRS